MAYLLACILESILHAVKKTLSSLLKFETLMLIKVISTGTKKHIELITSINTDNHMIRRIYFWIRSSYLSFILILWSSCLLRIQAEGISQWFYWILKELMPLLQKVKMITRYSRWLCYWHQFSFTIQRESRKGMISMIWSIFYRCMCGLRQIKQFVCCVALLKSSPSFCLSSSLCSCSSFLSWLFISND